MTGTTPRAADFRMPGEFEPHEACWMFWPWNAWTGMAFCGIAFQFGMDPMGAVWIGCGAYATGMIQFCAGYWFQGVVFHAFQPIWLWL